MRTWLLAACAAGLLAGCGGPAPGVKEATADDEKAAEQRIKDEAAREGKARQIEKEERKKKRDAKNAGEK